MFRSIVLSACLAGLGSGVVLTIAQQPTVAPIILAAETYESARVAEPGAQAVGQQHGELHEPAREPSVAHQHQHEHAQKNSSATHLHDSEQAWVPEDGNERTFWSLVTNVGMAIGFALLLCAIYSLLTSITVTRGVLWGLAGFVVFFANPALGLPPEIPGTLLADLFERQLWWAFAASCSALAVALIAWRRTSLIYGGAVMLLVLPHLIGAPQPEVYASAAPQALAHQFVWATTFVNVVFWLTLGVASALSFRALTPQAGAR